jgi:hypothetical protein
MEGVSTTVTISRKVDGWYVAVRRVTSGSILA